MNIRRMTGTYFAPLLALGFVAAASADTRLWNTTSGSFTDPASWLDGVPGAGDVAWFNHNFGGGTPPYTVTFRGLPVFQGTANYVNAILQVGPNIVNLMPSFDPSRGPVTYTVNSSVIIGDAGNQGVLNTTLPTFSGAIARISAVPNGQGVLNVNAGTFSVTESSQPDYELRVGEFGSGTMSVNGEAQVIVPAAEGNAVVGQHSGASGTVNVVGPSSVWNNASDSATAPLVVGDEGTGIINISGGGQVNNFIGEIAHGSGSVGSVNVLGPGSTWTNRGDLSVSVRGTGSLAISGGGLVTSINAAISAGGGGMGMVHVADAGSAWNQSRDLQVGAYLGTVLGGGDILAVGTLNISAGGQTNTHGDAFITAAGSRATVDGNGSIWTVGGQLQLDRAGILNISGGAHVRSQTALVSGSRDGTAHVSGAGSTWDVADILSLGRGGIATLNITAGGQVKNRVGFVGVGGIALATSSALVVVEGTGSTWTSSEQLFIGYQASGQFVVANGAQAFSGTSQIGLGVGTIGSAGVNGAGSKWTNSESLYVGVAGTGQLVASNGGTVVVDDLLSIGPHGTVEGNSHIVAEVRNGGTVSPGLSTSFVQSDALGTLHLDGDFTQTAAGTLQIQLASTTSFDKLAIDGHATLGGTLQASLFSGFSPAVDSAFQVLTATGGITGTFALDFSTLGTGTGPTWILVYSDSDVILKLVNLPTGDYNHDGTVDAADYIVWRKTDGSPSGYDTWRNHFGQTAGSGAGASANAAVPEPETLVLLIFATVGWRLWRFPS